MARSHLWPPDGSEHSLHQLDKMVLNQIRRQTTKLALRLFFSLKNRTLACDVGTYGFSG